MALSSRVTIVEGEPGARPIQAPASAVPAFVGITERGPIGEPVYVASLGQFRQKFGGFIAGANRDLPLAVLSFFEQGGAGCYIVRTVHYTDVTDNTTGIAVAASATLTEGGNPSAASITGSAFPLALSPADIILISVSGGGDATATFDAAAAGTTGGGGPYDLDGNEALTITLDDRAAQSYTFIDSDSAGATLSDITDAEVVNVINREFVGVRAYLVGGAVYVETEKRGTDATILVGGAARAVLGFNAAEQSGTGDVANIDAVTAAEAKAVIEADVAGVVVDATAASLTIATVATGVAATLEPKSGTAAGFGLAESLVTGSDDAAVDVLTIAERYAAGIAFVVTVSAATSGEADRFDLVITQGGAVVESYRNVSADPAATNYIVDLMTEGTSIFTATHEGAPGDPRPDNQAETMAGGNSGLTGLVDADFVGGSGTGKTGLRVLDSILDLTLVAIPGRASAAIATGLNAYVETTREGLVFAVHDIPSGQTSDQAITYAETTASLVGMEYGAVYWPHVKIQNPSTAVFGDDTTLTIPPSGPTLGLYSRLDGRRAGGVYDSPAGYERAFLSVAGLADETVNQEAIRDRLYPKRINPIRTEPGRPIYIDGGRTLLSSGNFPNISERRGVIGIKRAIKAGIDFARHQNHDASLRARVRRTVRSYLVRQMNLGAFRTTDPATAFYVTCDETNNPLDVVNAGRLVVDVGLATAKPAEFIEVTISQDTRGL